MYMQIRLGPASQQWKQRRFLAKPLLVGLICVLLVPVSRAQDALRRPDALICRPRLEAADKDATSAASRQQHQPQAICSLKILGHGHPVPGIKSIKFSCHNPSEPGAKVLVGLPSAALGSPFLRDKVASAVVQQLKQLVATGQGIQLASPRSQLCQTAAETTIAESDTVSLYGLLYFCQGNIRFVQPVVQDVWLPYAVGGRVQEDTAVIVVAGNASAVFQEAIISRNDASSAIAVLGTAEVEITNSTFEGNRGNPGSGVFVRDNATLRVEHSMFKDSNSSDYGGALAIMGCAAVSIDNTHIINNRATRAGGGLYVIEQAAVTITNSKVQGNQAPRGGGIAARSTVTLGRGTWVINNSATMDGGGLLIEGPQEPRPTPPELQVSPDAHITRNTAQGGAGVSIGQGVRFNDQAVREAVAGNRATDYDHDISVMPETLTLLNHSAEGLVDFVGRPGDDEGLLQGLSAWPGLEEINERTVPRMVAVTGPNGVVVFSLKFVQPPGLHSITFRLSPVSAPFMLGDFPTARLTVRVRPCVTGEREVRPGVCEVCPEGSYSFTNSSAQCLECPSGADCPGGHRVISQQGFWQSSLLSNQMHSRLDDPRFVRHYYFLLQDYKPKHRYWEAVVSLQTIGLVAVSVFCFTLGPYYQALALNVLLAAFALLLVVVQPLAHKQAMNVALASLLCLFLTSYTALTFAQHGSFIAAGSSHQKTAELLAIPMYMGAVVVVFNFVYIAWVVWQLFHLIRWRQVLENAKKAYAQALACSCCDSQQSEMTSQRHRHRAPPETVTLPREVIPGVGVFDAVTIMGGDQELGQSGRHRKQQQQHLGGHHGAESA
eukprot:gene6569-6797_t